MTIGNYHIGLYKADNFNQAPAARKTTRGSRLTPDEKDQREWQRRRRDWEKRQRGANRHHPARDREALSRLRGAVANTDHEHAPDIVRKLADCLARKSRCRLWICSRCSAERSHEQVARLVGNLADHAHSDLAAFTAILGAIPLNGAASAESAAAEARRQIERLRQHAKRSGVDVGYWGRVEVKIVRPSELDDTDHIATTLADLNPSSLVCSTVLVPHVHGVTRLDDTSIREVRQFFQKVFPANRQVMVKTLHDDQTTEKALSVWGDYSTKSEVKIERRIKGQWFADMLTGDELMIVSIFQKALKYHGGRFSYHLQLPEVISKDEFDEEKYERWLFSRCLALRSGRRRFSRARLLDSYEDELTSIRKRFWQERKSHYTQSTEGDEDDKTRKRSSPPDGTRRSDLLDGSIPDEPVFGPEERDPERCEQSDPLLPGLGAATLRLAVRPHSRPLGYPAGMGHARTDRSVPDG